MTTPDVSQQQFRSNQSGRFVVPGWLNLGGSLPDVVEVQLDVTSADQERPAACVLVEYWSEPGELKLQSVLPLRAFAEVKEGWCLLVPGSGRVLLRAIDPAPNPPVLASHWLTLEPQTRLGTVVSVNLSFGAPTPA